MERWLIDMKDMHELEIYAPIKGFPDYLVTNKGRVLSLKDNNGKRRIKDLKPGKTKDGYYYVNLYKNGKQYHKTVHRLVAQAFIPNPENKPQVNHIDEDKINNHALNLEWLTCKENNNHGTHNERVSKTNTGKKLSEETKTKMSKSKKGLNHPRAKSVIAFKINGCEIKYYKYISECENDGFHHSGISECCKGKLKSYKGYKWHYTDEFFNRKE